MLRKKRYLVLGLMLSLLAATAVHGKICAAMGAMVSNGNGIVFGAGANEIKPENDYLITKSNIYKNINTEQETYFELTKNKIVSVADATGKIVVPEANNQGLKLVGRREYVEYKEKGKYGLKTLEGRIAVPAIYSEMKFWNNELITVKEKGKWYVLNCKGEKITKNGFNDIAIFNNKLAGVAIKEKIALYDLNKNSMISKPLYKGLDDFPCNKYIVARKHEKDAKDADYYTRDGLLVTHAVTGSELAGIFNPSGAPMPKVLANGTAIKKVIAPFGEGIAFVKGEDGHKYAINEKGKIIFNVDQYSDVDGYVDGLAMVTRKPSGLNIGGVLNTVLSATMGGYSLIARNNGSDFSWTKSKIKHGYIDKGGKEIISSKNQAVSPLMEAGIMVYSDGKFGLYSKQGEPILPMEYKQIMYLQQKDAFVLENKDNKWGIWSATEKELVPFIYDEIIVTGPNSLAFKTNDAWSLFDLTNKQVSSKKYDAIIQEALFLDEESKDMTPAQYICAKEKTTYYYISPLTGEVVFSLPEGTTEVCGNNSGYAKFKQNDKWGVVDAKGNVIIDAQYDSINVE